MNRPMKWPRRLSATICVAVATLLFHAAVLRAQTPAAIGRGTPRTAAPQFSGVLTFRDAIERGLARNPAIVRLIQTTDEARSQQQLARSLLLPNVTGSFTATEQQVNLAALGVRFDIPLPGGASFPEVVGPFNVVDVRARVSQALFDGAALNRYRGAGETVRARELTIEDTRDAIVLAVGGAYLQVIAARARAQSARAQVETASMIQERAVRQRAAGLATPIDVNRAQVQVLTQRQRLSATEADLAKQKINLARLIGLPPTDAYSLGDEIPFAAAPPLTTEEALQLATEHRSDLAALQAQVRAAERAHAAAQSTRLPTVTVNADYGANKSRPTAAHQTFSVTSLVQVPIFDGGRTGADVARASAELKQRRLDLEDLMAQVEGEIRQTFFDLQAAASQVESARANADLTRQTLDLSRQRFEAGIGDNISIVQAQEAIAGADFDYINSVYAHNLAKLRLARSVGRAAEDLPRYLQLP